MSGARFAHFVWGVVCWVVYVWLSTRRGDRRLLHPLALLVTVPVLYLGTALPDWDITVLGIGGHRNPLFHSALPYFVLAWLWRTVGLAEAMANVGGAYLDMAVHVGLALGLASHLLLDVWDYGDVRWLPGGTLDRLWLGGHAVLLGLVAWYPPSARTSAPPNWRVSA